MRQTLAGERTQRSAEIFNSKHADLLTCFNNADTLRAIGGFLTATMTPNEPWLLKDFETAFLSVVDRGILKPEFMTPMVQESLEVLRVEHGAQPAAVVVPAAPENPWASLTKKQLDEMSSQDCKRLYRTDPAFRAKSDELQPGSCLVVAHADPFGKP